MLTMLNNVASRKSYLKFYDSIYFDSAQAHIFAHIFLYNWAITLNIFADNYTYYKDLISLKNKIIDFLKIENGRNPLYIVNKKK